MARKRFEGRDVRGIEVRVSATVVELDGAERFHVGEVVYVVVEASIDRVGYARVPKSDAVLRIEHATPAAAALIDADAAVDALELGRLAGEAARGILRLRPDQADDQR